MNSLGPPIDVYHGGRFAVQLWEDKSTSCMKHQQAGTLLYMGVSKNRGTPKSSILIGCSIINHPCWGTPTVFLETPI